MEHHLSTPTTTTLTIPQHDTTCRGRIHIPARSLCSFQSVLSALSLHTPISLALWHLFSSPTLMVGEKKWHFAATAVIGRILRVSIIYAQYVTILFQSFSPLLLEKERVPKMLVWFQGCFLEESAVAFWCESPRHAHDR